MTATREHPNGKITAYWGDATSCKLQTMDAMDWGEAQKTGVGPGGEFWSLTPQSENVIDGSPQGYLSPNSAGFSESYKGYYGNS